MVLDMVYHHLQELVNLYQLHADSRNQCFFLAVKGILYGTMQMVARKMMEHLP